MARRPGDLGPLRRPALAAGRRRFQEIFPRRFLDATYLAWERDYKWEAHLAWQRVLSKPVWVGLRERDAHDEVARRIASFYARSHLNMLALYEWMALREALVDRRGGPLFADGLFDLIHGRNPLGARVDRFTEVLEALPQRQSRLAKWPVLTLFPFVAEPRRHFILKPRLVKRAAERYGFDLHYRSRPNGETYGAFLDFVQWLRTGLASWHPRDLIDVQGFLWVTNSDEYQDWPWE
jgi:hypothetical protein